jgi:hypothetical protein
MEEMVDLSTGGDQDAINTFMAGKVRPYVNVFFNQKPESICTNVHRGLAPADCV